MKTRLITTFLFTLLIGFVVLPAHVFATEKAMVRINEGWNLYSLPFVLAKGKQLTASNLIKEFALQNGTVSTVATWKDGRWQEFVSRENNQTYGTDFAIELGKSYFIRSYNNFDLYAEGESAPKPFTVTLTPGYNFVSLPTINQSGYSSADLSKEISSLSKNQNVEVSKFDSGLYFSYALTGGKSFGKSFSVNRIGSYVIKVDNSVDLKK